ncbi:hypothetical protein EV424DRAFT_242426 [Suillus variegatus]|nr:hypothetical protein EV424DRAFT_242426 [Suillus variegatus]
MLQSSWISRTSLHSTYLIFLPLLACMLRFSASTHKTCNNCTISAHFVYQLYIHYIPCTSFTFNTIRVRTLHAINLCQYLHTCYKLLHTFYNSVRSL